VIDFGMSKAYRLLPHYEAKEEPAQGQEKESAGDAVKRKLQQWQESLKKMTNGPKFITPELQYLNCPPPYQYLEIKDPLLKEQQKRRRRPVGKKGNANDIKQKLKNMSLRDYIGAEQFRYGATPAGS
jgi:hypothetical protein